MGCLNLKLLPSDQSVLRPESSLLAYTRYMYWSVEKRRIVRVFANAQTRQSLLFSHTQDTCIEVSRNEGSCVSLLMHRLASWDFSSRIHKIQVLKCRETTVHACLRWCTDSTEPSLLAYTRNMYWSVEKWRFIRVFANAQTRQSLLFSHTQDTCIEVSRNEGSYVSSLMHRLARVFSSRIHKIHVLKCREMKVHTCLR